MQTVLSDKVHKNIFNICSCTDKCQKVAFEFEFNTGLCKNKCLNIQVYMLHHLLSMTVIVT